MQTKSEQQVEAETTDDRLFWRDCNIKVPANWKHWNYWNKWVKNFDHHWTWLNNCIIIDATNWRSKWFNYFLISIVCINHGRRTKTHWKPNLFPWSWNSAGVSSSSRGKISQAVECTNWIKSLKFPNPSSNLSPF